MAAYAQWVPRQPADRFLPCRRTLLGTLLVTVVLIGSLGLPADGRVPKAGPGAAGIGDPYFPLDGNGGYDVARYEVHDSYAFATGRLSGWTVVSLRATEDLTSFNLDFLLPVRSVTVNGTPAAVERPTQHELKVTPDAPLTAGSPATVRVTYAGRPAEYGYAGEHNWLASSREVVAMNQPHMAPWWFPSNDHPTDKAVVDVFLRVPRGNQVVANGRLRGTTVSRTHATWHWGSAEPMVPYLAFFAAGHFRIERGTTRGLPWVAAVSRRLGAAQQDQALTLLKRSPRIVRWLEAQFGPYPFGTTGGLVTALDPGFALENQTRPTYPAIGPGDQLIVVHELAHQWFGDDVAIAQWKDIWLNEGFATFAEQRWVETHHGVSAAQWLRDTYDAFPGGSSLWSIPIADPGPSEIFSEAVYVRGAMALQALRNRIGEADFWDVMRTWAADHHRGNGSDEEFRTLAETISGEDLAGFFTAWLDTSSKPADTAANGLG